MKIEKSPVSVSTIDVEKYAKLSEVDRLAMVKEMLQKLREESMDENSRDVPPGQLEYLND